MGAVKIPGGQTRGAAGRVALLLALLIVAAVTLRGRLPIPQPVPRNTASGDDASLTGVVALLSVSMLVMAFAMLHRKSGPPRPPAREFPEGPRGARSGWNLRLGLIAVGLLIAWLVAVAVLNRLGVDPETAPIPSDAAADPTNVPRSDTSPTTPPQQRSDTSRLLIATTAALLLMMVVATVLSALRRTRREQVRVSQVADAAAPAGAEPLALAAERGLAEVANPNLPPREAIIACYAAMEQALAGAPTTAPQASDTPSEVLARAVTTGALSAGTATPLVEVFAEARYSTHVMTEEHRRTAEQALRSVLAELRSPV